MSDSTAIWLAIIPPTLTGIFSVIVGMINKNHIVKVKDNVAMLEKNTNGKMEMLLATKDELKESTNKQSFDAGRLAEQAAAVNFLKTGISEIRTQEEVMKRKGE